VHLHGRVPGKLDQVVRRGDPRLPGCRDTSFLLVRGARPEPAGLPADEDFIASLPSELRGPMQRWFERFQLSLDDDIALFEGLYGRYRNNRRVKVQLAPANLHWCSDEALTKLADCSRKYDVPLHMHLLETA
jgi:5-methylthioadenosine/S-adenosylhomocysteine deaminase